MPSPPYSTALWADIEPIPLDEGPGPGPSLAAITYTEHYSTCMSYLRAVMAANEYSERALDLTADIIAINPAHYTVWLYRAKIVAELGKDVVDELRWVEGWAEKSLKNYQIWHYRQQLMSTLPTPPPSESTFLSHILSFDAKNYHVWSYRQWLVSHFDLFDSPQEIQAVEELLSDDIRNNSAWNHRWFLRFGREDQQRQREKVTQAQQHQKPKISSPDKDTTSAQTSGSSSPTPSPAVIDLDLLEQEIAYAKRAIQLAPRNQSPWNYLRALYRRSPLLPLRDLGAFAEQFTGPDGDLNDGVRSSYALEILAEICADSGSDGRGRQDKRRGGSSSSSSNSKSGGQQRGPAHGEDYVIVNNNNNNDDDDDDDATNREQTKAALKKQSSGREGTNDIERARQILTALGNKWDPIRKAYWDYRIKLLD